MSVDLRALLYYGSSPPLLHELGLIKRIEFAALRTCGGCERLAVVS